MPVDIAFGIVRLDYEDFNIPGKVPLVWDRHYSTALLDLRPTALGLGWRCRYFATLTHINNEYRFVTPEGATETFSDPENEVVQGGVIRNFGAFLEIFRQDQRLIVQKWDVESGEILRYCYVPGKAGEEMPLSAIEDLTGQGLDLQWNEKGLLVTVRQRLEGRELQLIYDEAGHLKKLNLKSPNGEEYSLVSYKYDTIGRQVEARDAADFADCYEYDRAGRLTREIAKDGGIFNYRYGNKGRCVKTTGLNGYLERRFYYLDSARITEVTDSYDQKYTYHHLPTGQAVLVVDPLGGQRAKAYDEYGRLIEEKDATGAVTQFTYDEQGNRSSVVNALGEETKFSYNAHHLQTSTTDATELVWQSIYDQKNRLVATIDPLGNRWQIEYDKNGDVAQITNPSGGIKQLSHSVGILEAETDWAGNVTRFKIDAFGRVTERIGPLGESTLFRYDILGNPTEVVLPDDSSLNASYDKAGNLTSFTDGNGYVSSFRYGPCGRLSERTDPVGGVVGYVWGSEYRRLDQVINEQGETYTFFRDEAGRIIRERSFDGAERHFKYDAEGYTIEYTNANGECISIQRDALHRVVGLVLPDGKQVTYSFDANGNLISAVNADMVVTMERDPLGRIIREVQDDNWVESHYDALGNLIHTATSLGHTVDYEFDANGFLSKLTTHGNQSLKFQHNANGQEIKREILGGVAMEQRYDDVGRLVEQRVGPGKINRTEETSVIPQQREAIYRSQAYSQNGSLNRVNDRRWGRVEYIYDPAERLLQALRQQRSSETFFYDPTGNITRFQTNDNENSDETFIYGPGNRLLQKDGTRYEYDAEGRRIKKIENANSEKPKVWLYEWNALDRLQSITKPDGETWHYKYDAMSRRIEKNGSKKKRQFLWDKDVVIHEFKNAQSISTWFFDVYSFAPLATLQNDRLYSVVNDHLGTPKELIDEKCSIVWSIEVDAWGGVVHRDQDVSETGIDCPIRFQGQWYDEESDLHYNCFRYYDPATTSFVSQDPIGLAGGWNLYNYVKNPINWIDPFGLDAAIDDDGFFAKSNEYGRGNGRGRVRIPYQGGRSRDFTQANRAAGFSSTPEGYTWHHANYNPRTGYGDMQLVKTSVHRGTSHSGGVSRFRASTGLEYDTCDAISHVEDQGRLRGEPCR